MRTWNATANGMESVASLFNDNMLALDEISQCNAKDIGAIVYAIANGEGKQRANRLGSARKNASWRCIVLSTGENTIETEMAKTGAKAKAGQLVRMIDINANRKHGAWDNLDSHGFHDGGAFSNAIATAADKHYGHAGRLFLHKLTQRGFRDLPATLEQYKRADQFKPKSDDGQDVRAAERFALVAMAGELATKYGVVLWEPGHATDAAMVMFQAQQASKKVGNREQHQILERVSEFIERHGDSRFSPLRGVSEIQVRDRAGWRDNDGAGTTYLFTAAGLREATTGFDFDFALGILAEAGALEVWADGKKSKPEAMAGLGFIILTPTNCRRNDLLEHLEHQKTTWCSS
jgi:putative DNA primase/helicase